MPDDLRALRIAFAGTPEFARTALQQLLDAGCMLPLVLTQPDRPAGRGMKLQASAVKQLALAHALPLAQPRSLRLDGKYAQDAQAAQQALQAARPDVLVVAAYGLILPAWVLALPRLGCVNIHGSLLPRWRGAAPVQRAIEAGDTTTGICIMQMDEGLDTGDILRQQALAIAPDDTSASLSQRLAVLGGELLLQTLQDVAWGTVERRPQPISSVPGAEGSSVPGVPCSPRRKAARHSLTVSPCQGKVAPGNGSKARMRRSITAASWCQSMGASALSILWA